MSPSSALLRQIEALEMHGKLHKTFTVDKTKPLIQAGAVVVSGGKAFARVYVDSSFGLSLEYVAVWITEDVSYDQFANSVYDGIVKGRATTSDGELYTYEDEESISHITDKSKQQSQKPAKSSAAGEISKDNLIFAYHVRGCVVTMQPTQKPFDILKEWGAHSSFLIRAYVKKGYLEHTANVTVHIGTWNVGETTPDEADKLGTITNFVVNNLSAEPPDICAFGLQEVDMTRAAVVNNEDTVSKKWYAKLDDEINTYSKSGVKYKLISSLHLGGLCLAVFARRELAKSITNVQTEGVRCGTAGMANKGGIIISFELHCSTFCFINSHFAAHQANSTNHLLKRNEDFAEIAKHAQDKDVLNSDFCFWFGDLNYRINMELEPCMAAIYSGDYKILQTNDQLRNCMKMKLVFPDFNEGEITFPPTYKYDKGTDTYDSSAKQRVPAYTDRILHMISPALQQKQYRSIQTMRQSDHRPLVSLYETRVKTAISSVSRPPTMLPPPTPSPVPSTPTFHHTSNSSSSSSSGLSSRTSTPDSASLPGRNPNTPPPYAPPIAPGSGGGSNSLRRASSFNPSPSPQPPQSNPPSSGEARMQACPKCGTSKTAFRKNNKNWVCLECLTEFAGPDPTPSHRLSAYEPPQLIKDRPDLLNVTKYAGSDSGGGSDHSNSPAPIHSASTSPLPPGTSSAVAKGPEERVKVHVDTSFGQSDEFSFTLVLTKQSIAAAATSDGQFAESAYVKFCNLICANVTRRTGLAVTWDMLQVSLENAPLREDDNPYDLYVKFKSPLRPDMIFNVEQIPENKRKQRAEPQPMGQVAEKAAGGRPRQTSNSLINRLAVIVATNNELRAGGQTSPRDGGLVKSPSKGSNHENSSPVSPRATPPVKEHESRKDDPLSPQTTAKELKSVSIGSVDTPLEVNHNSGVATAAQEQPQIESKD